MPAHVPHAVPHNMNGTAYHAEHRPWTDLDQACPKTTRRLSRGQRPPCDRASGGEPTGQTAVRHDARHTALVRRGTSTIPHTQSGHCQRAEPTQQTGQLPEARAEQHRPQHHGPGCGDALPDLRAMGGRMVDYHPARRSSASRTVVISAGKASAIARRLPDWVAVSLACFFPLWNGTGIDHPALRHG